MKTIRTEDAVGQVLCQDLTQIIPGKSKGPRFKKGHVVREEDIPVLLSMGKVNLYVWELEQGMVHENDAARRLASLCLGPGTIAAGEPSEGKIGINAATDGCLLVNTEKLNAVNATDKVMVATRKGDFAVREGDALAGTRVIPLVVREEVLAAAERAAEGQKLLEVRPFSLKTAAVIATGSEVASGLIEDAFTPVIVRKLAEYGIDVTYTAKPGDEMNDVVAAIGAAREAGVDLVVCTGGMSVDPDDNTPGAIKRAGARIVTYGSPVLPGAMLLVGYFDDDCAEGAAGGVAGPSGKKAPVPVLGVPGCAMYNKATVLDLVLPRVAAGVPLTKRDFVVMGEGGLCLGCKPCTFPLCPFGK